MINIKRIIKNYKFYRKEIKSTKRRKIKSNKSKSRKKKNLENTTIIFIRGLAMPYAPPNFCIFMVQII